MLSDQYRYIALDFETTGLDLSSDEPIQIGIVECDAQGSLIGGFQSLLRPYKPLKELKTMVGFITGLSIEVLEDAPMPQDILSEVKHFFGPNTVIVGHNIAFDLHFLDKFFPGCSYAFSVDTFKLSQSLLHYMPSYAQEILIQKLQSNTDFQTRLSALKVEGSRDFHDAFADAKLSLALFSYLIQKINLLIDKYPILADLLVRSEGRYHQLLMTKRGKSLTSARIFLPPLKKITPPHTQMLSGKYSFSFSAYPNKKTYNIKDIAFKELLSSLATHKKIIFSFSTKAKLDIAKNLLADLGIKNLGFAKEDQTLSTDQLNRFAQRKTFAEFEYAFFLKYFSHVDQGLGVLDLNSKEDFQIYTALKDQRKPDQYPIVLTTHGGLFSLVEQGRYADYGVVFFDVSWWYKSFNQYLSRSYDLNYTLNYLDMLAYKYALALEYEEKTKEEVGFLSSFIDFFTIFIGILGQETKKFFTNTDATVVTLDPIRGNIAFYQTNKLLERFVEFKQLLQKLLDPLEFQLLRKQIEHMMHIFEGMVVVEKKMYTRSDFYFLYAEEVKFTTWDEFVEAFGNYKTLFLTNFDTNYPPLIPLDQEQEIKVSSEQQQRIFNLSKTPSVIQHLLRFDRVATPNALIFILSVQKEQSKELFEEMIAKGLDQDYLLLVENITGGSGKNLFKAKSQGAKIVIGGYNFLLQLFAQKLAISELIVYNFKGNQQDVIFNDILRYGRENLR